MTPGKFLRLVWPSTGFYCIAHPVKIPGQKVVPFRHHVFDTISEAVTHCAERTHIDSVEKSPLWRSVLYFFDLPGRAGRDFR